jgi:electron transfer flavoprotein beta subunit
MYVPEKGRAQMIEGSVEEQAARVAQLIRERAGGAA